MANAAATSRRFSRDDRPRGDRPFRDRPARDGDGEKRAFKPRGDRPKFDRGGERMRPFKPREDRGGEKRPYTPRGRSRRGPPGRALLRSEVRRQEAIRCAGRVMATSALTRRAAKVFARTATGLAAIARTARARRATATGPSGSLAASANSPVAQIATARDSQGPARISAIVRRAANRSRGRSARKVERPARRDGERVSTSRVRPPARRPATSRVRDRRRRPWRSRAGRSPAVIGQFASGRNSIAETVRSSTGRA